MNVAPRAKLEPLLAPLALLYGALVFLPMLRNYFWNDDFGWVTRAMDAVAQPERWWALAKSDFRPLASLSFILNLRLSGLDPLGYYVFNLALHLAVVALAMALARRLTGSRLAAGLAGLLLAGGFGNYGEAILWICGRTGPLADVFSLGALIAHWDALERGRARDRVIATACYALALLGKESAVVLLPLMVLLEWTHGARPRDLLSARRLASYAPLALLLGAYLVFQFAVLRAGSPILGSEYLIGPHVITNLLEYLVRMFLPVTPSSMLVPVPGALQPLLRGVGIALMVLIPLFWLVVLLKRGTSRAVRFGVLWMLITLVPYVFFTFRTSARYLYTPSIGLALVLGSAAAAAWPRLAAGRPGLRRLAVAALVGVLITQAAVMQVIIHRRHVSQKEQSPALHRDLIEHARALGLR